MKARAKGKTNAVTVGKAEPVAEKMMRNLDEYVDGFRNSMNIGADAILRAAKCYSDALLRHPTLAPERFSTEFPGVSQRTWDILERIGNGDLNVNAFFLPYTTARRIAHISKEKQDRIFSDGVKGFYVVSPSTMKAKIIPLQALSDAQARLVLDTSTGRVRSVEEQKKIIERQTKAVIRSGMPGRPVKYEIKGHVCVIGGVEVGIGTLRKIIKEMEKA